MSTPVSAQGTGHTIPLFPQAAIVGSLGDLAHLLAKDTEVPEEFVFACGLTTFGALCVGKLHLNIAIPVEPRLYTVLLGKSYDTRKSSAERKIIEFFAPFFSSLEVLHGIGSAEGLAKIFNKHHHILVAYDEFSAFFDKAKVQASVLLPMAASLFESTDWDNPTKQGHISLRDAHLSLLGCCTEDTFERMWTREAVAIGFPNRLFVVWADRKPKVAWPQPADPAKLGAIRERIAAQLARLPLTLDIEPDAKQLWEYWYNCLPPSEHAKRLDTIGFRLMPLLALTTDKQSVDSDTVMLVMGILDYELSIRMATDPLKVDNKIAEVQEKIRRVLKRNEGGLTRSMISKLTNSKRVGTEIFKKALDGLLREGEVHTDKKHYWLNKQSETESPSESEA
jgi:hypothetical protein